MPPDDERASTISRRRFLRSAGITGFTLASSGCLDDASRNDSDQQGDLNGTSTDDSDQQGDLNGTPTDDSDQYGDLDGPEHFVATDGTNFTLDGDDFYYSGGQGSPNLESIASRDMEYDYDDAYDGDHYVADVMRFGADVGTNVLRIFVSPDWEGNTMHEAPGEFNDDWFERFDTIVAEAKRNDIRLVVSLLGFNRGVPPSPSGYAGMSDTVDDDLPLREQHDAFFTDDRALGYHRNLIEYLLTRENTHTGIEPRNDPTVMMWECGNEIEYAAPDRAGESLADWYDDTARFIKSIDDNHIVGSGMHGADDRNDFLADHQSDAIDACSFHIYPLFPNMRDLNDGEPYSRDPWKEVPIEDAQAYIERRVTQAHDTLGKPVYLGEFGTMEYPDIYGWDIETRNEYFDAMYDTADEVDLDGVNVYALELDLKFTGETKITDGRDEFAIYPDDSTTGVIQEYAETAASKSETTL